MKKLLCIVCLCAGCAGQVSQKSIGKLADLAYDRQDFKEAERLYKKACDSKGCARSLLKMQKYQDALLVADQALNHETLGAASKVDLMNLKGVALSEMERLEEAIALFRTILEKEPYNITALNNLGLCLILQKKFSEAEKVLKRAIAKYEHTDQHENAFRLAKRLNNDAEQDD
jgi:Flp pilus assembly protein TadD